MCTLRLTGLTEFRRRVAIEYRNKPGVWGQIGDPSAADRNEPKITLNVECAALEKLTLRRIADVGEFFHRTDPWGQWRQAPRLNLAGGLNLGSTAGTGELPGSRVELRGGIMFALLPANR